MSDASPPQTGAAGPQVDESAVLSCRDVDTEALERVLGEHGVRVVWVPDGEEIPASYWGDREAGIRGKRLFLRADTPVHSALHEGCHVICAAADGRTELDTDAGGEQLEEDAVCYLQIVLAERVPGFGRERACADMDAWGYSFRLGSAGEWFRADAEDARAWLVERGVL